MLTSGTRGWATSQVAVLALLGSAAVPLLTADGPEESSAAADRVQEGTALQTAIDDILADERLEGSGVGVVVREAGSGETLYEHNPDLRLNPASNTKLLTSAAAMDLLGPDYTWTTTVHANGDSPGNSGLLKGDLYLRGDGDPTMLEEDYESLAAQVAASGIRQVQGDLVADDTRFDDQRLGGWWSWRDEDYYYSAQISPLTVGPNEDYDAGTIMIETSPGAEGEAASIEMIPATDYVTIDNQVTTGPAGSGTDLSITRERGTNDWVVSGTIAADADTSREWRAVWEPTGKAAAVFAKALERHGVTVKGGIRVGEATPEGAREVAAHESMTVTELLDTFMALSNNGHGEALTKTLGAEIGGTGDWPTGTEVIKDFLMTQGFTEDIRLVDGSGLSRGDQISAEDFAAFLVDVRDEPWYDAWLEEIPLACGDGRLVGGTLRARMCDTPAENNVRAKSGSLTGVTGLSGYVTDADDRELVFSILLNNNLVDVKDIEDRIAVTLASYSEDADEVPPVTVSRSGGSQTDTGLEPTWLEKSGLD